jgi:hypothetical protein
MRLESTDRRPRRQARSERVADVIVAAAIAGLLLVGAGWWM